MNAYSCTGGLTRRRLLDLVGEIASRAPIGALAFTAFDPSCDVEGRVPPIAADLVRTVVGSFARD